MVLEMMNDDDNHEIVEDNDDGKWHLNNIEGSGWGIMISE